MPILGDGCGPAKSTHDILVIMGIPIGFLVVIGIVTLIAIRFFRTMD